ncbi:MAG: LCP family protein [Clostridiales bacterium]|nr:LCP family protein [Clostridiales bacterium]
MAKDRRDNKGKQPQRQVSLADKAGVGQSASPAKKGAARKKTDNTKRKPIAKIIIVSLLVILVAVTLGFLIVVVKYVWDTMNPKENNAPKVQVTSFVSTPEADRDKVAYYLVGVLGADAESKSEMLSVLCWDKQKKTINILEFPQDTYLGDSEDWTVRYLSNVWNNPKPLDWCETDRRQLKPDEIKDGKHVTCGTDVTQKPGSPPEQLIDAVNQQFGLPIDDYFLFPQEGFVKLVNLLGGVDVSLEEAMTVGEISYGTGVQPLDGEAALYYMNQKKDGVEADLDRIVRRRKVMSAVLQRLFRSTQEQLEDDVLGPLQKGSTPIRTYGTYQDMIEILLGGQAAEEKTNAPGMKDVPLSAITAYILPGEAAKSNGQWFYGTHKDDLVSLLNGSFLPYASAVTAESLGVNELAKTKASDLRMQIFSEISVEQSLDVTIASTTAAPAA